MRIMAPRRDPALQKDGDYKGLTALHPNYTTAREIEVPHGRRKTTSYDGAYVSWNTGWRSASEKLFGSVRDGRKKLRSCLV
ncbi:hypothetical protein AX14_011890 [Amanita brunnescens Koide BX004]|nr:hypothetical protein AX14_011890 [Amanita brunnescens Koide BX004]